MCRIFGFRSVIQSQVHNSLLHADNALASLSREHPNGWGVAYYVGRSPHIIRSEQTAIEDKLFQRVSGIVSSNTVLAHIRKATLGSVSVLNTHPFQYGRWSFAHNGNIKDWDRYKDQITTLIHPHFRRFILGDTDSEKIFFLIMSHLMGGPGKEIQQFKANEVLDACRGALEQLQNVVGPFNPDEKAPATETFLTFVITDGETMLAHQGGQPLYYSTYKTKCSERSTCPSFAPECEAKSESGKINHLIFSSEQLSGENIWLKMSPGEIIGSDHNMTLL